MKKQTENQTSDIENAAVHAALKNWLKTDAATAVIAEANKRSGSVVADLEQRQQLDPTELQKPFTV